MNKTRTGLKPICRTLTEEYHSRMQAMVVSFFVTVNYSVSDTFVCKKSLCRLRKTNGFCELSHICCQCFPFHAEVTPCSANDGTTEEGTNLQRNPPDCWWDFYQKLWAAEANARSTHWADGVEAALKGDIYPRCNIVTHTSMVYSRAKYPIKYLQVISN